jgi:hypothetical protein
MQRDCAQLGLLELFSALAELLLELGDLGVQLLDLRLQVRGAGNDGFAGDQEVALDLQAGDLALQALDVRGADGCQLLGKARFDLAELALVLCKGLPQSIPRNTGFCGFAVELG